jgi:hypothetical protein
MLLDRWVTATDLLILNKHSLAAAWRTQGTLTLLSQQAEVNAFQAMGIHIVSCCVRYN